MDTRCLLEWCAILDKAFGRNYATEDFSLAVELAGQSSHPDAQWLSRVCAGKDYSSIEARRSLFSALGDDPRALCFLWMTTSEDIDALRRAAVGGFPFAQAEYAGLTKDEERFKFSSLAAQANERDGFFWLGRCYQDGVACKQDLGRAIECYRSGSALGDFDAMGWLGEMLKDSEERWHWLGVAAVNGNAWRFLKAFQEGVEGGEPRSIFLIGRVLNGRIRSDVSKVSFSSKRSFTLDPRELEVAELAAQFYKRQLAACKIAVDAWVVVAKRFGVVKDIRRLTGEMIWAAREEASYQ
jgi:hypothetical protein